MALRCWRSNSMTSQAYNANEKHVKKSALTDEYALLDENGRPKPFKHTNNRNHLHFLRITPSNLFMFDGQKIIYVFLITQAHVSLTSLTPTAGLADATNVRCHVSTPFSTSKRRVQTDLSNIFRLHTFQRSFLFACLDWNVIIMAKQFTVG